MCPERLKILWTISIISIILVVLWLLARRFAWGTHRPTGSDSVFGILLNKSLPNLILDDLNSIASKTLSEVTRVTSEVKNIVNTRLDIFDEL